MNRLISYIAGVTFIVATVVEPALAHIYKRCMA